MPSIEIVDDGPRFDPLEDAPLPDPDAPLEDRPVGGLGVHLVRTMMDEMTYRYGMARTASSCGPPKPPKAHQLKEINKRMPGLRQRAR